MLQLRFLPQERYLLAHLTGLVSLQAWEQGLRDLQDALVDVPGDRLVVDLTGLVGWLGDHERTQVGGLMAVHLGRMKRVALYIQQEKIAGKVQAEARRKGLDLHTFPSYDDAVRWAIS